MVEIEKDTLERVDKLLEVLETSFNKVSAAKNREMALISLARDVSAAVQFIWLFSGWFRQDRQRIKDAIER